MNGCPGLPTKHPSLFQVPVRKNAKIGIIGIGGLYAAKLLQERGIDYEILEASSCTGGRIYTHVIFLRKSTIITYGLSLFAGCSRVSCSQEVGAMRFPAIPITCRLFELVLELQKVSGLKPRLNLMEYYFDNANSTLLYNEVLMKQTSGIHPEDFHVRNIPPGYGKYGVTRLVDNVLNPFVKALADDYEMKRHAGWNITMEYDIYSTRVYMSGNRSDNKEYLDELKKMPYPTEVQVVNWLETFDSSIGSYDVALSEAVLDKLAFDYSTREPMPTSGQKWFCFE
ncbi:hypothetical protein AcW1_004023 [Taiwanofungus camphoratus]|nr:hypothetical protein AcW1_004023 [Antrodia cinnamomea]